MWHKFLREQILCCWISYYIILVNRLEHRYYYVEIIRVETLDFIEILKEKKKQDARMEWIGETKWQIK